MDAPAPNRLELHWPHIVRPLEALYGDRADYHRVLSVLEQRLAQAISARPPVLRDLDASWEADPHRTARSGQTTYSFYVDRFAGDLRGVASKLDYLEELGVRWLHALPLLEPRAGDSDGGFAVRNYRRVDPRLGSIADVERLAQALRDRGMGLILDVVCNHTAREHAWAQRARRGDATYRGYYIVLDQAEAERHSRGLIDVFPNTAPGSFTWEEELGAFVWTTFYPFQWDLNYANPSVFLEVLDILIFLASQGVQGLRLDSAPFLWKREGTAGRNLPEAHLIVAAWRAALAAVAPSTLLIAEAIEHIDDVCAFFGSDTARECDLAYNNGVMTALWGALADQDAEVARRSLRAASAKPEHGAWLNYARCHDDLIWNTLAGVVDASDLARWSRFYGEGAGFSKGRSFQTAGGAAPSTNGMASSLAGIDREGGAGDHGLRRLRLIYGVIHALDGWPMIYMGDEIGLGDDEEYGEDPAKARDGRWLHRPAMDWTAAARRLTPGTAEASLFAAFRRFGRVARMLDVLGVAGPAIPIALDDRALLAFVRDRGAQPFLCLANLSGRHVATHLPPPFAAGSRDLLAEAPVAAGAHSMAPWEVQWLTPA